jgi:hypothetical protein
MADRNNGSNLGFSSAWQLLPEEVVVIAGCLPPIGSSRYWAFTPYVTLHPN